MNRAFCGAEGKGNANGVRLIKKQLQRQVKDAGRQRALLPRGLRIFTGWRLFSERELATVRKNCLERCAGVRGCSDARRFFSGRSASEPLVLFPARAFTFSRQIGLELDSDAVLRSTLGESRLTVISDPSRNTRVAGKSSTDAGAHRFSRQEKMEFKLKSHSGVPVMVLAGVATLPIALSENRTQFSARCFTPSCA